MEGKSASSGLQFILQSYYCTFLIPRLPLDSLPAGETPRVHWPLTADKASIQITWPKMANWDTKLPDKEGKKAKWQSQNTYRAHKHKDPERLKNPEGTGQTTRPTGKDKIPDLQTATPSCFTSNSLKQPDVSQKSQSQRQKPAEETKKDQMPRKQNHRKQKDKYSEVCWWPPWWHHRGDVTL